MVYHNICDICLIPEQAYCLFLLPRDNPRLGSERDTDGFHRFGLYCLSVLLGPRQLVSHEVTWMFWGRMSSYIDHRSRFCVIGAEASVDVPKKVVTQIRVIGYRR